MLDRPHFGYGSSVGGKSVFGAPNSWVRSSTSSGILGTYNGGRPKDPARFLAVIWQINVLRRGANKDSKLERTVRLQVEAPRYHENAVLNQIKRELITSLMESELRQVAFEVGFTPDESRINTSAEQVRTKRTITVFKTLLNQDQLGLTPEATVEAVHNELGWIIDSVVQRFDSDLTEALQQRGATRPPKIVHTKDKKEYAPPPLVTITHNSDKQAAYQALVKARKDCRTCQNPARPELDLINASVIDHGRWDCNHIGAFSQWQGNLNAELMPVQRASDWRSTPSHLNVCEDERALATGRRSKYTHHRTVTLWKGFHEAH